MRALGLEVVHQLDAGGGGQRLARLLQGDVALELKGDALGVGAQHGHAHAGAVHAQLGQVHNLAALVLQLHLLRGKALKLLAANLRNQVARQLGGKRTGLRNLLAAAHRANLSLKLQHAGHAGAGCGLVGGADHALHA